MNSIRKRTSREYTSIKPHGRWKNGLILKDTTSNTRKSIKSWLSSYPNSSRVCRDSTKGQWGNTRGLSKLYDVSAISCINSNFLQDLRSIRFSMWVYSSHTIKIRQIQAKVSQDVPQLSLSQHMTKTWNTSSPIE